MIQMQKKRLQCRLPLVPRYDTRHGSVGVEPNCRLYCETCTLTLQYIPFLVHAGCMKLDKVREFSFNRKAIPPPHSLLFLRPFLRTTAIPKPLASFTANAGTTVMRFRKSRASDGLLGGQDCPDSGSYDDERKLRAFKKKFYFTLIAAVLTIAVSALRRYRRGEWWALFGDSGLDERLQTRVGLSTTDDADDVPRKCTKSPLEKRQARPQYGCADIDVCCIRCA